MDTASGTLAEILVVEPVGAAVFEAAPRLFASRRKFGGETAGQAVIAAGLTVPDGRALHSCHVSFMAAGDSAAPTRYEVTALRDGGTFSTRRVEAWQGERRLAEVIASFQAPSDGFAHVLPAPELPLPEAVPAAAEQLREDPESLAWYRELTGRGGVEIRFPDGPHRARAARGRRTPPRQTLCLRSADPLPPDDLVHRAALVYLTDYLMLAIAAMHHGMTAQDPRADFSTIDHTVWFHDAPRADDWLLHVQDSPWSGDGRAMCRGSVHDRDGRLLATTGQQGVLRHRRAARA